MLLARILAAAALLAAVCAYSPPRDAVNRRNWLKTACSTTAVITTLTAPQIATAAAGKDGSARVWLSGKSGAPKTDVSISLKTRARSYNHVQHYAFYEVCHITHACVSFHRIRAGRRRIRS